MAWNSRLFSIRVSREDDDTYSATEDSTDTVGVGDNPQAAVIDYAQRCREKVDAMDPAERKRV
ncbi:hypothetical protein [Haloarchaeobius sp. DFWS5]|uniref:hypothetical protein n=1 Tax=Haloarchaeobius sp. DFWS5 TaxID=3446114 RepID=UPI003EBAD67F